MRRALVVLAVLLAGAGVASWAALRAYGPALTRERIESALSDALGRPVRVGGARFQPWLGRLAVTDIAVAAGPRWDDGALLTAARGDVSIRVESLWRRQVVLSIAVTDLDLAVAAALRPAGGGGGGNGFVVPDTVAIGPLTARIGVIRLARGRVRFRDPEAGQEVEVLGVEASAWPRSGDLDAALRADSLRVDLRAARTVLRELDAEVRLGARRVAIGKLAFRWETGQIRAEGAIERPWVEPVLALTVRGDLPLGPLARLAGHDLPTTGVARVEADVRGAIGAPRVSGRVAIPELALGPVTARQVAIHGTWSDGALSLDDVQAQLLGGRLRGSLTIPAVSPVAARVTVGLAQATLPGALGRLGSVGVSAEARVIGTLIELERAHLEWRDVRLDVDGRIEPAGAIELRGRAAADLGGLGRAFGSAAIAGRAVAVAHAAGRFDAPTLAGRIELDHLVVSGQAIDPVEAEFRLTTMATGGAGAGRETSAVSRLAGTIRSPRLALPSVRIEDLAAEVAVDAERLELFGARARIHAVPVELTGAWAWAGSGSARAVLGPAALGALPGVPPAWRLGGTGRGRLDVTVRDGIVSTSGSIGLGNVSVAGLSFGTGTATLSAKGTGFDAEIAFPDRKLEVAVAGRLGSGSPLTARARVVDLGLRDLMREIDPTAAGYVDGRVTATGNVLVPLDRPHEARGTASLEPGDLRILGASWRSRDPVVVRWEAGRLHLDRLRLDGSAGTLTASGLLWSPDAQPSLALGLDNARLAGPLAALGAGTVRADARLAGRTIEVTRLAGRWPGVELEASGRMGPDATVAATGRLTADAGRLARGFDLHDVAGEAALTLDARGRWDAPELRGEIRTPSLRLAGVTLTGLLLPFRFAAQTLRIDGAALSLGESRITATGTASWAGSASPTLASLSRDLRLALDVRAPAARIRDLDAWLPPAFHGTGGFAVAARIEGAPAAWRGVGTLTSAALDLGLAPLRGLEASFAVDAARVAVTALRARVFGVPLSGTGTWAWSGGGRASAELGPARLGELPGVPAGLSLRGTGRGHVTATMGSAPDPADLTAAARVVLEDVVLAGLGLGRGTADVAVRGGEVTADLAFPGRRLTATAGGRLTGSALTARAAIEELALVSLLRELAPATASRVEGTVSARATARIPVATPRATTATLTVEPHRLVLAGERWESRGPVELRWGEDGLRLDRLELQGRTGVVTGAGTLTPGGVLDLRLDGRLPLEILPAMRPEIREAAGAVEVTVRASGPVAAPRFTGEGTVRQASVVLRDRAEALRDVEARFTLSSRGVRLGEASGTFAGGRLRASGDLAMDGWRPGAYRLALAARGVGVPLLDGLSAVWDADLELAGLGSHARLQGEARLIRGTYTRALSLLSLVLASKAEAVAEPAFALPIRIRVTLDNDLVVRNRATQLRVRGAFQVEGTTAAPILFGTLESRDGLVVFRGHRFTVVTAAARFADPRRVDPLLDFVGTARIGAYDVTAEVRGRASDVTLRLSSSPPLPQDDLLTLVTFGVTREEFRQSAGGILAGELGKLFVQDLLGLDAGTAGLDVLEFESGEHKGQTLRVGKQVTERALVVYSRNVSDGREQKLRIEYQLGGPVLLSGEHDFRGAYGADLILRLRLR